MFSNAYSLQPHGHTQSGAGTGNQLTSTSGNTGTTNGSGGMTSGSKPPTNPNSAQFAAMSKIASHFAQFSGTTDPALLLQQHGLDATTLELMMRSQQSQSQASAHIAQLGSLIGQHSQAQSQNATGQQQQLNLPNMGTGTQGPGSSSPSPPLPPHHQSNMAGSASPPVTATGSQRLPSSMSQNSSHSQPQSSPHQLQQAQSVLSALNSLPLSSQPSSSPKPEVNDNSRFPWPSANLNKRDEMKGANSGANQYNLMNSQQPQSPKIGQLNQFVPHELHAYAARMASQSQAHNDNLTRDQQRMLQHQQQQQQASQQQQSHQHQRSHSQQQLSSMQQQSQQQQQQAMNRFNAMASNIPPQLQIPPHLNVSMPHLQQQQYSNDLRAQSSNIDRGNMLNAPTQQQSQSQYNSPGLSLPTTPQAHNQFQLPTVAMMNAMQRQQSSASAPGVGGPSSLLAGQTPPTRNRNQSMSMTLPQQQSQLQSNTNSLPFNTSNNDLNLLKEELGHLTRRLEDQAKQYYSTQREMIERLTLFSQWMSAMHGRDNPVLSRVTAAMAMKNQQQSQAFVQQHQMIHSQATAMLGPTHTQSQALGIGPLLQQPLAPLLTDHLYSPSSISRMSSAATNTGIAHQAAINQYLNASNNVAQLSLQHSHDQSGTQMSTPSSSHGYNSAIGTIDELPAGINDSNGNRLQRKKPGTGKKDEKEFKNDKFNYRPRSGARDTVITLNIKPISAGKINKDITSTSISSSNKSFSVKDKKGDARDSPKKKDSSKNSAGVAVKSKGKDGKERDMKKEKDSKGASSAKVKREGKDSAPSSSSSHAMTPPSMTGSLFDTSAGKDEHELAGHSAAITPVSGSPHHSVSQSLNDSQYLMGRSPFHSNESHLHHTINTAMPSHGSFDSDLHLDSSMSSMSYTATPHSPLGHSARLLQTSTPSRGLMDDTQGFESIPSGLHSMTASPMISPNASHSVPVVGRLDLQRRDTAGDDDGMDELSLQHDNTDNDEPQDNDDGDDDNDDSQDNDDSVETSKLLATGGKKKHSQSLSSTQSTALNLTPDPDPETSAAQSGVLNGLNTISSRLARSSDSIGLSLDDGRKRSAPPLEVEALLLNQPAIGDWVQRKRAQISYYNQLTEHLRGNFNIDAVDPDVPK